MAATTEMKDKADESADIELDKLLSDALNDFGKSIQLADESKTSDLFNAEVSTNITSETLSSDLALLENLWNEPSMKEAMSHFENSIRSAFSSSASNNNADTNASTEDSDDKKMKDSSAKSGTNDVSESVDIDSIIQDFRKMAKITADTFSEEGKQESNVSAINDDMNIFSEEFSKNFIQVAQKLSCPLVRNELSEDEEDNRFHSMVMQTIRNLSDNNKDLEKCGNNLSDCSQQLEKFLKGIENSENVNKSFFKFMKVCMKTIKLVVYPSLKDLCDKYPIYIENNKSALSESEMASYEKQYEVMVKICKIFEVEEVDESKNVDTDDDVDVDNNEISKMYTKFLNILSIMKEIQDCGQIPEELVQNRNKLFNDGSVNVSNNEDVNSRHCSIS